MVKLTFFQGSQFFQPTRIVLRLAFFSDKIVLSYVHSTPEKEEKSKLQSRFIKYIFWTSIYLHVNDQNNALFWKEKRNIFEFSKANEQQNPQFQLQFYHENYKS
jgi:hypothetical protein